MKTPCDSLVEEIIPQLITLKLFLPEDTEKYRTKLTSGTMKEEDWLLAVEKAIEKEAVHE
jgi:hypothetical protein